MKVWKLGIVGWPLGYSLSPAMHQAALQAAGLQGEYKQYPVRPQSLKNWLGDIGELGLDGFNVTMPHKEPVFQWVSRQGWLGCPLVDEPIEALNTVVMKKSSPVGYNTDGMGFLQTLVDPPRSLDLTGWQMVLLGSGGVARAIATILAESMQERTRVYIWNRHPDKAKRLARHVNRIRAAMLKLIGEAMREADTEKEETGEDNIRQADPTEGILRAMTTIESFMRDMTPADALGGRAGLFQNTKIEDTDLPHFAVAVEKAESLPIRESQLVINATPAGMRGQPDLPLDLAELHKGQVVYDIVYEPRDTKLVRTARERGCRVITGDEMLVAQGALSFEIWTGVKAGKVLPAMRKALDEHFAKRA